MPNDDLWAAVSIPEDAHRTALMSQAQVAAAQTWGFLADASSQEEFEDRLTLSASSLDIAAASVASPGTPDYTLVRLGLVEEMERNWDALGKTAADLPVVSVTQGEGVGTWNVFRYDYGTKEQSSVLDVPFEDLPADAQQWMRDHMTGSLGSKQAAISWYPAGDGIWYYGTPGESTIASRAIILENVETGRFAWMAGRADQGLDFLTGSADTLEEAQTQAEQASSGKLGAKQQHAQSSRKTAGDAEDELHWEIDNSLSGYSEPGWRAMGGDYNEYLFSVSPNIVSTWSWNVFDSRGNCLRAAIAYSADEAKSAAQAFYTSILPNEFSRTHAQSSRKHARDMRSIEDLRAKFPGEDVDGYTREELLRMLPVSYEETPKVEKVAFPLDNPGIQKWLEDGRAAFAAGLPRIPPYAPAGMPVGVGYSELADAWLDGWDQANIDAPFLASGSVRSGISDFDGAAFDRWLTTEPEDDYGAFCEANDLDPNAASSAQQYSAWVDATDPEVHDDGSLWLGGEQVGQLEGARKTAWNTAVTSAPIVHPEETVPPRPLLPGDTVVDLNGKARVIRATSDTWLRYTDGGSRHRGPVEGDFSGVIPGQPGTGVVTVISPQSPYHGQVADVRSYNAGSVDVTLRDTGEEVTLPYNDVLDTRVPGTYNSSRKSSGRPSVILMPDAQQRQFKAFCSENALDPEQTSSLDVWLDVLRLKVSRKTAGRVSPEQIEAMRALIAPLDTPERREFYRNRQFARADATKDLDVRYRWDLLWASKAMEKVLGDSVMYDRPDNNYNDAHIDTALRSIVSPLSNTGSRKTAAAVHEYGSSGEAYDASQTSDSVAQNDILVVPSEQAIAVLLEAWPVAVTKERGMFHTATDPATVGSDEAGFRDAWAQAQALAAQKGWPVAQTANDYGPEGTQTPGPEGYLAASRHQAVEVDEYGEPLECIDSDGAGTYCRGPVEYRSTGGNGAWPRCEKHGQDRLDREQELRVRYPTIQPPDFDPDYAGERWDDDY